MPTTYNINNLIRLSATFKNATGTLTNPGTVTLKVQAPDGVKTTYTGAQLTNSSTGVFSLDLLVDKSGPYLFWFEGTTGVTAADGGEFNVAAAKVS